MTRQWMYFWRSYSYSARAQDSGIYLPPELPGLIGKVRAADPDCCWFFERAAPSGTEGIGIWVQSAPDVVDLPAGFRPRDPPGLLPGPKRPGCQGRASGRVQRLCPEAAHRRNTHATDSGRPGRSPYADNRLARS